MKQEHIRQRRDIIGAFGPIQYISINAQLKQLFSLLPSSCPSLHTLASEIIVIKRTVEAGCLKISQICIVLIKVWCHPHLAPERCCLPQTGNIHRMFFLNANVLTILIVLTRPKPDIRIFMVGWTNAPAAPARERRRQRVRPATVLAWNEWIPAWDFYYNLKHNRNKMRKTGYQVIIIIGKFIT